MRCIPSKTGYKATMWGIPYDDLDGWRGPYPPEVFAAQFEKMAEGWRPGIAELQVAVEKTPPDRRNEAQADLRLRPGGGHPFPVGRQPSAFRPCPRRPCQTRRTRCRPRSAIACGPKSNDAWNPRSFWPANSSRSCGRIRGSALNPRASTSTCRWTWWKKWSIAAGCWSSLKSKHRSRNNCPMSPRPSGERAG